MKKLVVLVLLGLVGYFGYVLFERQHLGHYGISNEHPLGEFEKLDAILTKDLKLLKSSISRLGGSDVKPTAQMYQYRDSGNRYIYVALLLDNRSNVQGVAGWYHTPTHSPVMFFINGHWRRSGGSRGPQFTGYRMGAVTKSQAEFTKGQVKGTWEKSKDPQGPTYEHIYLRVE